MLLAIDKILGKIVYLQLKCAIDEGLLIKVTFLNIKKDV